MAPETSSRSQRKLDEALSRLARSRGDKAAWAILYKLLWPRVMAITFRILRGVREAAEDVSQDVFLRLLRYCDFQRIQDSDEFERYLHKVAEHAAFDYLSQGRRLIYDEGALEARAEQDVGELTPDEVLQGQELRHKILGNLTPSQRNLAELLMKGYTTPEIALACGWTYGSAGVRIHRLREALRNLLNNNASNERRDGV